LSLAIRPASEDLLDLLDEGDRKAMAAGSLDLLGRLQLQVRGGPDNRSLDFESPVLAVYAALDVRQSSAHVGAGGGLVKEHLWDPAAPLFRL